MPKLFNDTDNMGATASSAEVDVKGVTSLALQIVVENNVDAIGVLTVEGSADRSKWTNISFQDSAGANATSVAVATGTDSSTMIELASPGFHYIRLTYTDSTAGSGSGDLNAWLTTHRQGGR